MEKTILPPCPSLDADTEAKLRRYGALLLETNERVRLVGPRDETTLWNEHIADCLRLLPLLPPSGSVIDVGTGGGLPGAVLAICRPDLSFTLLDDQTEGPRCVRIGDLFSDDFCRFRSGENEMSEDMTELLYGTEGSASWGFASYDPEEMILRYVTETQSGLRVELILRYTEHYLTEIILQTVNT